jgi:hypothetical protein
MREPEDTTNEPLRPGARVHVRRDERRNGPWPAEPTGTIETVLGQPFQAVTPRVIPTDWPRREDGTLREYMVVFDEPQTDGEGDGPYRAAVIWETYLEPLDEPIGSGPPPDLALRKARDAALRAVLEHPEVGEPRP